MPSHSKNQTRQTNKKMPPVNVVGAMDIDNILGIAAETDPAEKTITSDINPTARKKRTRKYEVADDSHLKRVSWDEIFGPESERSGELGKIEGSQGPKNETKEVAAFRATLIEGQEKGRSYRGALNQALRCAYQSFYDYKKAPWSETRKEMFKVLKELAEGKFEVTEGKTKAEHIIVQLTFGGDLPTATTSQRARLLRLAISEGEGVVKPKEFLHWLEDKGGIVNALKNPNTKTAADKAVTRKKSIDAAKSEVRSSLSYKVQGIKVSGLPAVDKPALALAIIERDADGNFAILGFSEEPGALDAACVAHAKTLNAEVHQVTAIGAAAQHKID